MFTVSSSFTLMKLSDICTILNSERKRNHLNCYAEPDRMLFNRFVRFQPKTTTTKTINKIKNKYKMDIQENRS